MIKTSAQIERTRQQLPRETDGGTGALPAEVIGGGSQQFKVKSIGNDHVICNTWDGVTLGTVDVVVAKPYHLRRSTWHSVTRDGWTYSYSTGSSRTATNGDSSATHVIFEAYAAGDVIYADRPVGGTGVTFNDRKVRWCDQNRDARRWVEGCS